MSAPDTSSSKARPSLLSDTAKSAADSDSRILASLEGRVAPQQPGKAPRRSGRLWGVAAVVAVLGAGAFGAWQWQRGEVQDEEKIAPAQHAAAQQREMPAQAGSAAVVAAAASGADVLGSAASGAAAHATSAPQPAVIVADNSADNIAATQSHSPISAALSASAPAAGSAPSADQGRLSRALTASSSTSAAAATSAVNAPGKHAAAAHEATKRSTAHAERDADKKRHATSAHARKDAKTAAAKPNEDQDVDLLTALVARTKPYDAKKAASADKAASGGVATRKNGRAASLADQVAECSKRGLIESQFCRWHVCADHWGKDPACPTAGASTAAH
ncbi:phage tail protein [Trinickia caryophylli]|uniref:Uncharacterized protein n=1 Tax=Trinickia caryophylli TaxID=28094 RepID=A0A1X7CDJ3_TRICW|nr:hypothetical protein [Trinickia caryophylli]PMS12558.1 phage tail protein [Trinickia caryophylli]TRX19762.1 phage tail protein [Trinickia caryophylli]WQE12916.1 phage tail protein [Trinickia caryophylli]SME94867.1 hypothetical protein SAMN06295900_101239 [Trinickia caryophylli]GLU30643.1 hypothetical protein Busp01_04850 [Trinickia caryophylli]